MNIITVDVMMCIVCRWFLTDGVLCFFFFKRKTAYEWRISDWSSDVCSSDLPTTRAACRCHRAAVVDRRAGKRVHAALVVGRIGRHRGVVIGRADEAEPQRSPLAPRRRQRRRVRRGATANSADRKSVVEGKSVSVRVDPGGRRSIKKKK